jgi:imidazolonepropionase-like amidohydrolase
VTTVERKSGYGLDSDNEIKMLRVARQIGFSNQGTFLGARTHCRQSTSGAVVAPGDNILQWEVSWLV